jgi:two-component system, LytTR family, response regulator
VRPQSPRSALRVLVVDDEPLARRNLSLLLQRDPDVAEIAECSSGTEAITALRSSHPDVVFLDVQMPECDGFDVLELLGSDAPATIIFVTAYDSYALRAFEAGALDYLLKPFDDARFQRSLARVKERIAHSGSLPPRPLERLLIRTTGQVMFVNVADIDWIEAADYYACLHINTATQLLRRTLSDLERDLADNQFVRIHRSIIVNLERIRALELDKEGEYEVVLKSGLRLRLSRRFRKPLQDRLKSLS